METVFLEFDSFHIWSVIFYVSVQRVLRDCVVMKAFYPERVSPRERSALNMDLMTWTHLSLCHKIMFCCGVLDVKSWLNFLFIFAAPGGSIVQDGQDPNKVCQTKNCIFGLEANSLEDIKAWEQVFQKLVRRWVVFFFSQLRKTLYESGSLIFFLLWGSGAILLPALRTVLKWWQNYCLTVLVILSLQTWLIATNIISIKSSLFLRNLTRSKYFSDTSTLRKCMRKRWRRSLSTSRVSQTMNAMFWLKLLPFGWPGVKSRLPFYQYSYT